MSKLDDQINAILKRVEHRPLPQPHKPIEERIRDALVRRFKSLEWLSAEISGGRLHSTGEIIYFAYFYGEDVSRGGTASATPYVHFAIVECGPHGDLEVILTQPVEDVQQASPKLLPVIETQVLEPEALDIAHHDTCNKAIIPALYELYVHVQKEPIAKKKKHGWLSAIAHATRHLRVQLEEKTADRRDRYN